MKKIKSYEEFNEEINWKQLATGAALGASLAFGSPVAKTQTITNQEQVLKDKVLVSSPIQKKVKKILSDKNVFFKMTPGLECCNYLDFDLDSSIGKDKVKISFILKLVMEDEENYHYKGDYYQTTEISNLDSQIKEKLLQLKTEKPEWISFITEKTRENSFEIKTNDVTKLIEWLYQ